MTKAMVLGTSRWLSVGAVLAALLPRPGLAGESDSLSAPPSIAAGGDSAAAAPPPVTIEFKSDSTVAVAAVAWHSDGYLLAVRADGSESVVETYRVRKVLDGANRDRTRFVLDQHGAVGTVPPGYQGHIDPARFEEKKSMSTGGALGFVGGMLGVVALAIAVIFVVGLHNGGGS